jgi:hypothetical protein
MRQPLTRSALVAIGVVVAVSVGACSSGTGAAPTPSTKPTPTATALTAKQKAAEAARIAKAPSKLTATCSAKGVAVSSPTVAARKEGVDVVTVTTSTSPTRLRYVATPTATPDQQFAGSLDVQRERTTSVFPVPPGTMELTCQTPEGKPIGASKTVTVYDRNRFYRAVDIEKVLGCRPTEQVDGPTAPPRATSAEALDKLMETIPGDGTFTYVAGPGYPGSTADAALVKKNGKGYGTAVSELQRNGAYVARLTSTC